MIKVIKNRMKTTPKEPTLMKILKSFLAVNAIKIGYIMNPQ